MVGDVIQASLKAGLERIAMSDEIMKAVVELREFLYERVYFNDFARDELRKTEKIIRDLFDVGPEEPGGLCQGLSGRRSCWSSGSGTSSRA